MAPGKGLKRTRLDFSDASLHADMQSDQIAFA
jgi:hypothetical protein